MSDAFRPWTPDFADQISEKSEGSDSEVNNDHSGQKKRESQNGRKRPGSNHDGLRRRAPVQCVRR